jgi:stalled ribosome rescue protein Dom34
LREKPENRRDKYKNQIVLSFNCPFNDKVDCILIGLIIWGMLFGWDVIKLIIMSQRNKKQFGVWMDSHHATLVGKENADTEDFVILCNTENKVPESKSSEKTEQNAERTLLHKFFKAITSHMQNAEEVHVTGPGTAQEQFIHYMAETPQFKNTIAIESTSNKMSDGNLIAYIAAKFN